MTRPTPYNDQPDTAFWRRGVAELAPQEVDPVGAMGLTITPATRVATAGSCFAQHISRRLAQSGFNYFVAEPKPSFIDDVIAREFNYGTFSARSGNIYTARQLLQLLQRAYGAFEPGDDAWIAADGTVIDPYRPAVQPGAFASLEEFRLDRCAHLAAVRRMVEQCDLFVFTLGLTECWANRADGAVYPLCPGVAGGTYDADRHVLLNLTLAEVADDLRAFLAGLHARNPQARVLLTVSPVPLIATATGRHVLTATTYSKSVLRVAAEMIAAEYPSVFYFPAYEVITGAFSRGRYYAENCRDVTEAGVDHVMRLFFRHIAGIELAGAPAGPPAAAERSLADIAAEVVAGICDEEKLERLASRPRRR